MVDVFFPVPQCQGCITTTPALRLTNPLIKVEASIPFETVGRGVSGWQQRLSARPSAVSSSKGLLHLDVLRLSPVRPVNLVCADPGPTHRLSPLHLGLRGSARTSHGATSGMPVHNLAGCDDSLNPNGEVAARVF